MAHLVPTNFTRRIVFSFLSVFLIVFAGTGFWIGQRLERVTLDEFRSSLRTQVRLSAQMISREPVAQKDTARVQEEVLRLSGLGGGRRVTVIAADGVVLGDSERAEEEIRRMDNHQTRPEFWKALKGQIGFSDRFSNTLKVPLVYAAAPLWADDGKTVVGAVRIAVSLESVDLLVRSVRRPVIAASALGVLVIFVVGIALGRGFGRRIQALRGAASRFAGGDFSRPAEVHGDDELRVLAESMNDMAVGIERQIAELDSERTKLAAILESMAEGVIAVDADKNILIFNA
ncbi:MAG: HAMP domain-containing protein, partial [Candidatus Omnitrophica bacterium]|nr:HAMP domain-containing protein [Candidatus Omnitrophota bacterium]